MEETTSTGRATILRPTKSYPTYQLYVKIKTALSPETAMVKCVLHVYQWLNERKLGFESQFKSFSHSVDDYANLSLSDFENIETSSVPSFKCIFDPDGRYCAFRLKEPDGGLGTGDKRRDPVPGRQFETNVGFRIVDNELWAGFETIATDFEDTNTECEVLRLGCIKKIANDPDLKLFHGFDILDGDFSTTSNTDAKDIAKWVQSDERQMLMVIAFENLPKSNQTPALSPNLLKAQPVGNFAPSTPLGTTVTKIFDSCKRPEPYSVDMGELSVHKMGYSQFFEVRNDHIKAFCRESGMHVNPGDILVCEPKIFGGTVTTFAADKSDSAKKYINSVSPVYSKNKPFRFTNVFFIPQAEIDKYNRELCNAKSIEEIESVFQKKIDALNEAHSEEISKLKARLNELYLVQEKFDSLQADLRRIESETVADNTAELEKEILRLTTENNALEEKLSVCEARDMRPKDAKSVAAWAEEQFEGRLIFHDKAKKLMDDLKSGESDIALICDGLEFLAIEYRNELIGFIDETEMNRLCSVKYGRPFEVTMLNAGSIEKYPKDYKIKYKIGAKGKPVETPLDRHLRVGNKSEDLLRIYFLYDDEKQLIVVGSLPKHLKTVKFG